MRNNLLQTLLVATLAMTLFNFMGCKVEDEKGIKRDKAEEISLVNPDGTYKTVPLEIDSLVLKIVQNSVENIDSLPLAKEVIGRNLTKVKGFIEEACTTGEKPHMILLNEFPLTGYISGSREEKHNICLTIPGPESDQLSALAKKYDTYIVFGSYVKDEEWPGHILSITTVIGRDGEIVKKIWKPKNIKRFYSTFELTTTTVENVQKKFRAKYGIDEEFPIVRTEYGNFAFSTVQLDPMVFAALTMKGAEVILRTATYYFETDVVATSMMNNVYSAMANIAHKSRYGGNSIVVDPYGRIIGKMEGNETEGVLSVKIPIKKFREGRTLPQYSLELTSPIFDQYVDEIPPNHNDFPADKLPKNGKEMKKIMDSKSRWLNNK